MELRRRFGDRLGCDSTHKYKTRGTYRVGLTITDSAGFTATVFKTITVVRSATIKNVSVRFLNGIPFLLVKTTGPGHVRERARSASG